MCYGLSYTTLFYDVYKDCKLLIKILQFINNLSIFLYYRYRGSTDDLRRSREDISVPSLIPKLLSSRNKEDRLKRQDSKDDIRHVSKSTRKDSKEEVKSSSLIASPASISKDEIGKLGIRIFRRDNSREDVGRESTNSIKDSAKGKQQERQERTEGVASVAKSKVVNDQSKTRYEDGKDKAIDVEGSSLKNEEAIALIEQNEIIPDSRQNEKTDVENQETRMFDIIVAENRTQKERMVEQSMMVVSEEMIDEKHVLATRKTSESVSENDKERDNDEEESRDTGERLLDTGSDGDVTGIVGERKGSLEVGYGKKPDEFQVVSEYACELFAACGRNLRSCVRMRGRMDA